MSCEPFGISPVPKLCSEPRLALHPMGTLLWFPLDPQRLFPVLCHPSSLVLGLSTVRSRPSPRSLLPIGAAAVRTSFRDSSLCPHGGQMCSLSLARAPRHRWLTLCSTVPLCHLSAHLPQWTLGSVGQGWCPQCLAWLWHITSSQRMFADEMQRLPD